MGMKSDLIEFTTERSVQDLGRRLQQAMQQVKAHSVEPVDSGSGALAVFDDHAEIEVVAQGKSLIGGYWVVQVYVIDHGHQRQVCLVALGDGGFSRAWNGARNTVSLSASIGRRDTIATAIR
ncbi:hypothetical protein ABCS02_14115 [Microbacterium sp. X-17]|uniref:hypothetical protein n=1 Tax=Microbacterium sp. X-17 TaxID=3144404 RepID=UPI0031F52433